MKIEKEQGVKKQEIQEIKDLSSLLTQIIPEDIPVNLDETKRRRLEIAIRALMGQSQAEICAALGCSKDTARYWMAISQTEKANIWQENSVGRPKIVNESYLKRLRELVTNNPQDYGYSFQRWTAKWLSKHLAQELGIEISDRHVNRLLKQMGLSTRNQNQSIDKEKSLNQSSGIAINDLNPALGSQFQDLIWWFQNKV